jgi:VWFA-related protein
VLPASAKAAILRYEGAGTASRTRDRLQLTLDALTAIAQNLKSLPGRKNLIWVSEGFPFSIGPGTIVDARDHVSGRNYTVSISSTANALFDSQIAIYPIDSRGIITSDVYDPASRGFDAIGRPQTQIGLTSTVSEENNNLDVVHSSMQEIAERTGGRAFTTAMRSVRQSLKAWMTEPRTTRWLIRQLITIGTANSAASA